MPTRTLYGWTPGSPIDGQRLRLHRNMGLAGTYDFANDVTSKQVDVVEYSLYQAELRSYRELDESTALTKMFYVGGGMGFMAPTYWGYRLRQLSDWLLSGPLRLRTEEVPPPTGTISVSDP